MHPGDKSSLVRQVSRIERQASQQLKLNHVRKDDTMEGVTLSTMMRVFYSIPAGPLYCSSTLLLTPPFTLNPTCIFVDAVKFAWRLAGRGAAARVRDCRRRFNGRVVSPTRPHDRREPKEGE